MPLTEDLERRLGAIVDRAENALHGMKMPVNPTIHLQGLEGILREIRDDARKVYVEIEGNDPWETSELDG